MIGCFGKLPASADFVSLHGAADEVCEFDAWVQGSLAAMRHRPDWQALFDPLPVCFFSYRASNGNWLLGGMLSSRDASERRYPFYIFQLIKGQGDEPLVNPFTLSELFCTQIRPLLHQAVHGACSTALFERIKALRALQAQDVDLYRRVHAKFLHDFKLADIATALRGAWTAFDSQKTVAWLRSLKPVLRDGCDAGIALPLPAERGLKNPTADLWVSWLTRLGAAEGVPSISLLADDFMRPKLYCLPWRHGSNAYRLLTGTSEPDQLLDLLTHEASAGAPRPFDIDRSLDHLIDHCVDAPDALFA